MAKKPTEQEIKETWTLARRLDEAGDKVAANRMRDIAISQEKAKDSWLYRNFGW